MLARAYGPAPGQRVSVSTVGPGLVRLAVNAVARHASVGQLAAWTSPATDAAGVRVRLREAARRAPGGPPRQSTALTPGPAPRSGAA